MWSFQIVAHRAQQRVYLHIDRLREERAVCFHGASPWAMFCLVEERLYPRQRDYYGEITLKWCVQKCKYLLPVLWLLKRLCCVAQFFFTRRRIAHTSENNLYREQDKFFYSKCLPVCLMLIFFAFSIQCSVSKVITEPVFNCCRAPRCCKKGLKVAVSNLSQSNAGLHLCNS